ncbi:multidrug resistance-like protein [Mariannaea sp. PMI_226]|nr:multidrug resistance-like protein [Mariannaea sp. PMI_226]
MPQNSPSCPPWADSSFGPWAGSCRSGFDFTLYFEETILSLPVLCLFLIALPFRLSYLIRADVTVVYSAVQPIKSVSTLSYVATELVLLILWPINTPRSQRTTATIPTAALSLLASLGVASLSWLEHRNSIRPSFILTVFLLFSSLLDVARTRTLWMLGLSATIPAVFTVSMALRCLMLTLESIEKRKILSFDTNKISPESTSGPVNRSLFFWLSSLFLRGYNKILTLDDLYPLESHLESSKLHGALQTAWDKVPDKNRQGSLFFTWLTVQYRFFLLAALPKLIVIGLSFAQPFLVSTAIAYAGSPNTERNDSIGYGLIGAYVLVYVGLAISTGQYEWAVYRTCTSMRGALVPCIFNKTLRLQSEEANSAASLTLVTTDIETIAQGVIACHEVWSSFVEISLAVFLLARQVGVACTVPVGVTIFVLVGAVCIATPAGIRQAAWIKASQLRVANTSKTLGSIRSLRLSGLNSIAFSHIEKLRSEEIAISRKYRSFLGFGATLGNCAPILTPILMFITFAGVSSHGGSTLTISRAFTSLTLLQLLTAPLGKISYSLPTVAGGIASLARIQAYLVLDERTDSRLLIPNSRSDEDRESHKLQMYATSHLPEKNQLDTVQESEIVENPLDSHDIVASIQGSFTWPDAAEPVLRIEKEKLEIRRGTFTLITGQVGSGKSTLLKAILGELRSFKGTIRVCSDGIAYCSQSTWIPARAIRDVILDHAPLDLAWYNMVLDACALQPDLDVLPLGDNTNVGSTGISLSGGQKQRIALARAIYSQKEFLILDDVLSGLDLETKGKVVKSLVGPQGILRQRNVTTVLSSCDAHVAKYADHVLILDELGTLESAGVGYAKEFFPTFQSSEDTNTLADTSTIQQRPAQGPIAASDCEDLARQTGDAAVYMFYFRSAGLWPCLVALFGLVLYAFSLSFPTIWLKWWSEANEKMPNAHLGKWLGVYAALGVGGILGFLIGAWEILLVVIARSGLYFHTMLVNTVSRATMQFFAKIDHGITINRFSQDLQLVDMELPSAALNTAAHALVTIAQFTIIGIASRFVAIVFPFLGILFFLVQRVYLRTSRQLRLLDIEHKAPLYSHCMETISGLITIRAFGHENEYMHRLRTLLDESQRPYYLFHCLQAALMVVLNMIIAVLAVLVIIFSTTLRDQIGPGYVGVALSNILTISNTIKSLIAAWVTLEISIGAVARIRAFVKQTKLEEPHGPPSAASSNWPVTGDIQFRNVTASYGPTNKVLDGVSLFIQSGQKIAVCGRSGSGKTSLALSLFRMIDIEQGELLIDGVNILALDPEYIRTSLVAIPQDVFVLKGTVRFNLDPSEALEEAAIVQTLERLQLWESIEKRGGLDVSVEDGTFSQGELQLLNFARAMLRNSRIIILDESTSSLDNDAKAIVNQALKTRFADWTVISILHHLDTIQDYDYVALLDGGKLVEFEDPTSLLARDSAFKRLFDYQKGKLSPNLSGE